MAHRLYPKVLVYFWVDERVLDQLPDLLQYPRDPPRSLYLHETNGPETPTEAFHSLHVSVAWKMSKNTSITYHVNTVHNRNILGLNPESIDK